MKRQEIKTDEIKTNEIKTDEIKTDDIDGSMRRDATQVLNMMRPFAPGAIDYSTDVIDKVLKNWHSLKKDELYSNGVFLPTVFNIPVDGNSPHGQALVYMNAVHKQNIDTNRYIHNAVQQSPSVAVFGSIGQTMLNVRNAIANSKQKASLAKKATEYICSHIEPISPYISAINEFLIATPLAGVERYGASEALWRILRRHHMQIDKYRTTNETKCEIFPFGDDILNIIHATESKPMAGGIDHYPLGFTCPSSELKAGFIETKNEPSVSKIWNWVPGANWFSKEARFGVSPTIKTQSKLRLYSIPFYNNPLKTFCFDIEVLWEYIIAHLIQKEIIDQTEVNNYLAYNENNIPVTIATVETFQSILDEAENIIPNPCFTFVNAEKDKIKLSLQQSIGVEWDVIEKLMDLRIVDARKKLPNLEIKESDKIDILAAHCDLSIKEFMEMLRYIECIEYDAILPKDSNFMSINSIKRVIEWRSSFWNIQTIMIYDKGRMNELRTLDLENYIYPTEVLQLDRDFIARNAALLYNYLERNVADQWIPTGLRESFRWLFSSTHNILFMNFVFLVCRLGVCIYSKQMLTELSFDDARMKFYRIFETFKWQMFVGSFGCSIFAELYRAFRYLPSAGKNGYIQWFALEASSLALGIFSWVFKSKLLSYVTKMFESIKDILNRTNFGPEIWDLLMAGMKNILIVKALNILSLILGLPFLIPIIRLCNTIYLTLQPMLTSIDSTLKIFDNLGNNHLIDSLNFLNPYSSSLTEMHSFSTFLAIYSPRLIFMILFQYMEPIDLSDSQNITDAIDKAFERLPKTLQNLITIFERSSLYMLIIRSTIKFIVALASYYSAKGDQTKIDIIFQDLCSYNVTKAANEVDKYKQIDDDRAKPGYRDTEEYKGSDFQKYRNKYNNLGQEKQYKDYLESNEFRGSAEYRERGNHIASSDCAELMKYDAITAMKNTYKYEITNCKDADCAAYKDANKIISENKTFPECITPEGVEPTVRENQETYCKNMGEFEKLFNNERLDKETYAKVALVDNAGYYDHSRLEKSDQIMSNDSNSKGKKNTTVYNATEDSKPIIDKGFRILENQFKKTVGVVADKASNLGSKAYSYISSFFVGGRVGAFTMGEYWVGDAMEFIKFYPKLDNLFKRHTFPMQEWQGFRIQNQLLMFVRLSTEEKRVIFKLTITIGETSIKEILASVVVESGFLAMIPTSFLRVNMPKDLNSGTIMFLAHGEFIEDSESKRYNHSEMPGYLEMIVI